MAQQANLKVTISIANSDLDNEELQEEIQNWLEQIEDNEIAETAELVAVSQAPKEAKTFGGFILGMLTAEVNPANIKKLMKFLSDRLGNKQIELTVESPDGRKLNLKASSKEEFDYAFQKAQEWVNH